MIASRRNEGTADLLLLLLLPFDDDFEVPSGFNPESSTSSRGAAAAAVRRGAGAGVAEVLAGIGVTVVVFVVRAVPGNGAAVSAIAPVR